MYALSLSTRCFCLSSSSNGYECADMTFVMLIMDSPRAGVKSCRGLFGTRGLPRPIRQKRPVGKYHNFAKKGAQNGNGLQVRKPSLLVLPESHEVNHGKLSFLDQNQKRCLSQHETRSR